MKTLTPKYILGQVILLVFAFPAMAQSPLGVWHIVDADTGEARSEVEIYDQGDLLYGRILKLLPEGQTCDSCFGQFQGSNMRGVVIIRDMEPDGSEWSGGSIIDPESGRTYDCRMELDGLDRLRVRGFVGVPLFGRTQVWERVR